MKIVVSTIIFVIAIGALFYFNFTDWIGFNTGPTPSVELNMSSAVEQLKLLGLQSSDNLSGADRNTFAEKLKSLAQSVNVVTIGQNCVLSPAIISLKSGSDLTFINQDTIEHGLGIAEEIKIMAGKETTIKVVFGGSGVYSIACDGSNIVGFIDLID